MDSILSPYVAKCQGKKLLNLSQCYLVRGRLTLQHHI